MLVKFRCDFCDMNFTSKHQQGVHLKTKNHMEKSGILSTFSKNAATLYNDSLDKSSVKKNFPCDLCQKVFDNGQHLNQHFKTKNHLLKVGNKENFSPSVVSPKVTIESPKTTMENDFEDDFEDEIPVFAIRPAQNFVKSPEALENSPQEETEVDSPKETEVDSRKETEVDSPKETEVNSSKGTEVLHESDSSSDHETEEKMDKFKCDLCTETFSSEFNLMTHVELKHEEDSSEPIEKYQQKLDKLPTEVSHESDSSSDHEIEDKMDKFKYDLCTEMFSFTSRVAT